MVLSVSCTSHYIRDGVQRWATPVVRRHDVQARRTLSWREAGRRRTAPPRTLSGYPADLPFCWGEPSSVWFLIQYFSPPSAHIPRPIGRPYLPSGGNGFVLYQSLKKCGSPQLTFGDQSTRICSAIGLQPSSSLSPVAP